MKNDRDLSPKEITAAIIIVAVLNVALYGTLGYIHIKRAGTPQQHAQVQR